MPQDTQQTSGNLTVSYHFKRERLNQLFMEAMQFPLIFVCAGAGYGKTTAVHDFVQEYHAETVWMQLSERDNVGARFWENFAHSMSQINIDFAESLQKLGFPDTQDKLKQYQILMRDHNDKKRKVVVFDDCHFIENADVIKFVEEAIRGLPVAITVFLISRSTPRLNIAGLSSNNKLFEANEEALRFTESELAQYFREQGISLAPDNLRTIMEDTEGWAFALNYIARSYKKAPGYEGYLRNAMKSNIFRFMETEIWCTISARLQDFLVRLSLIDHLSIDLIALLAGADINIVSELEKQNAYVRIDSYINAFLIHPLFLEFLATKQNLLTQDQKHDTYTIAGAWCNKNGFKIDAISYYEKIGNYKAIVDMFIGSPSQIPYDIARFAETILRNAPQEAYDTVVYLASTHLRTLMCQGLSEESDMKAAYYEELFLKMPEDNPFRRSSLCSIYYCWIIIRTGINMKTDNYDFHLFSEKLCNCYPKPINPGNLIVRSSSPWVCAVSASRKGSLSDFSDALKKSNEYLSKCFISFDNGEYELALGEIMFYQGDMQAAESYFAGSMNIMRKTGHLGILHKSLFYILRAAFFKGDYIKAAFALKEMKANLDNIKDFNRFMDYDISLCWYYCTLGLPEKSPDWLKENFSHYASTRFLENYTNQMKARYCYATRNFAPLLLYIFEMKQRVSYLYGRIELFAMEACIHYKLKDKKKAFAVLEEAYKDAAPNKIIMPFIELGKDMRTLTAFALKSYSGKIPKSWLEEINRRSASYAKRLSHVIAEYRKENRITDNIIISPRENEVLTDLSHGLSRNEIAVSRNLSINTVKMLINNIYMKLGAENLADAIRIATERKIV
ncbi:MAG: LuxR C-terminal-related transcriptional regulator [Treponema sp.]|nr:LuxR C-terminal-related transcriptional regulator [Treponema sp.]